MEEFLLALYRKTNCKIGHVVDSDKEIEKLVVIDLTERLPLSGSEAYIKQCDIYMGSNTGFYILRMHWTIGRWLPWGL